MIKQSCSKTQRSDSSEAQTHNLSVSNQALYHWATYYIWLKGGDLNDFWDIKPFYELGVVGGICW